MCASSRSFEPFRGACASPPLRRAAAPAAHGRGTPRARWRKPSRRRMEQRLDLASAAGRRGWRCVAASGARPGGGSKVTPRPAATQLRIASSVPNSSWHTPPTPRGPGSPPAAGGTSSRRAARRCLISAAEHLVVGRPHSAPSRARALRGRRFPVELRMARPGRRRTRLRRGCSNHLRRSARRSCRCAAPDRPADRSRRRRRAAARAASPRSSRATRS